jgi:hypothetical protein
VPVRGHEPVSQQPSGMMSLMLIQLPSM